MNKHLVITAVGSDRPGLVNSLSNAILDTECSIEDSRMSVLGGEFAIIVLVSGNWNNIAKLETQLQSLEKELEMTIIARRTERRKQETRSLPYLIEVVALDHPGIVYNLASFFSRRSINIENMSTSNYAAAHTGSPMFSVNMTIQVPANEHIASLREEFMEFCDDLNLDAVMEPVKS